MSDSNIKFNFIDRTGKSYWIHPILGQSVEETLISNGIPPASVIVLENDQLVNEQSKIKPNTNYEARLIEGYDIESMRDLYGKDLINGNNPLYTKRLLLMTKEGEILKHKIDIDNNDYASYIEKSVYDIIKYYNLIEKGDNVLLGYSGGVDSSSLLTILQKIKKANDLDFNLAAATFEDFDIRAARKLHKLGNFTDQLGVDYHILESGLIEDIYNLKEPIQNILNALMATEYSHFVMYIDHHTTMRALQHFAEKSNFNKITLGLHVSDLLGGWINSVISGYQMGNLPLRTIGNLSYIYPLMFISKKELHIYFYAKYGKFIKQSSPNPWEFHPKDRNFYYYLSDIIQYYWPGIEYYLFNNINKDLMNNKYVQCSNCGSHMLSLPLDGKKLEKLCDVCQILLKKGFIDDNAI
jgi:tRNA(Ile)-lysidine synthase TilS/MesJ